MPAVAIRASGGRTLRRAAGVEDPAQLDPLRTRAAHVDAPSGVDCNAAGGQRRAEVMGHDAVAIFARRRDAVAAARRDGEFAAASALEFPPDTEGILSMRHDVDIQGLDDGVADALTIAEDPVREITIRRDCGFLDEDRLHIACRGVFRCIEDLDPGSVIARCRDFRIPDVEADRASAATGALCLDAE